MTFKQLLKVAEDNHIRAHRLLTGEEVENYLTAHGIQVSEDEFETICCFVYEWITQTVATPLEVIDNLVRVINSENSFTFSNINEYWDDLTDKINRMF